MSIQANDFKSNSLTGTTTVVSTGFTAEIETNKLILEGSKSFRVIFREGGPGGRILTTSPLITLEDNTYISNISANVSSIGEGETVQFDISTVNIPSGSYLFYDTLGNVTYNDFVGGNTGITLVTANTATVVFAANADLTTIVESDEQFQLRLRGTQDGPVANVSPDVVLIRDTSNVIGVQSVVESSASIFESKSVVFNINTINASGTNAGTLYYTITGNSDVITSVLPQSLTVSNNLTTLELIVDSTIPEGETRTVQVQVRRNSNTGPILATSNVVVAGSLNDTTTIGEISRVISVVEDKELLFANGNVAFNVTTIGGPISGLLYYDTDGSAISSNFVSGNTGLISMSANVGRVNLFSDGQVSGSFRLRIKRYTDGHVLAYSNVISVPQALGGETSAVGTIATHAFLDSGTLLVTEPIVSNILVVAGGGQGGPNQTSPGSNGGGGGGAGGLVHIEKQILFPGTYVLQVGGGGTNSPGSNSSILNPSINVIALGGGRGGVGLGNGQPGGSGGGGGGQNPAQAGQGLQTTNLAIPSISRIYGYGSAGKTGATPGAGKGGGGASSTFEGAVTGGMSGIGITWVPTTYGQSNVLVSGTGQWFAGGGGGGRNGLAGFGGGGAGGRQWPGPTPGFAANVNSGGGGGGGGAYVAPTSPPFQGGNGGSGIILFQYDSSAQLNSENIAVSTITANTNTLTYDKSVRFTVNTTGASEVDYVYWTLTGNALPHNLAPSQATSGVLTLASNVGYVDVTANSNTFGFFSNAFTLGLGISRQANSSIFHYSNNLASFKLYDGLGLAVSASGTYTSSDSGGYTTLTFTGAGSFTISDLNTSEAANFIEYLVVAGGGGGGDTDASGGGAGGFLASNITAQLGNYTVVVGAAGGRAPGDTTRGNKGGNSYITAPSVFPQTQFLTEGGGGGAAGWRAGGSNAVGQPGGSGGGSPNANIGQATGVGGGNPGGAGSVGGGGGGAGAAGNSAGTGVGGIGKTWLDGVYYSDGGGGGFNPGPRVGGSGRGGTGVRSGGAGSAQVNSGSGGGGGGEIFGNGGDGGSGIVKIRYLTP